MVGLLARTRAGDKEAFGELVRCNQGRVFAVAYGILGNADDAQDVAQEAFLRAYRALGSLKSDAAFVAWLLRIVTNLSINYKKRGAAHAAVPLENTAEPVSRAETPEEYAERRETMARLAAALAGLTAEQRAVLALREIEGLSYEDMAAVLAVPLGTVKSRLNHARARLRQALFTEGEDVHEM